MKIYFSAALAQQDDYGQYYEQIVAYLEAHGHRVFQDTTTTPLADAIDKDTQERMYYYRTVVRWISMADIVVVEVSFPSTLHIGHEISLALERQKPVIALYHQGKEPSFFLGLSNKKLFWGEYAAATLTDVLDEGLEVVTEQTETRFNLFLTPQQQSHLSRAAKHSKMARSVYLRKLIDDDSKEWDKHRQKKQVT